MVLDLGVLLLCFWFGFWLLDFTRSKVLENGSSQELWLCFPWSATEGTVAFCGSLAIAVGQWIFVWYFFVSQWWWTTMVADLGEGVWMAFVARWGWWFCPSRQEWRRRRSHVTPLAIDTVLSVVDPAKPDLVDLRWQTPILWTSSGMGLLRFQNQTKSNKKKKKKEKKKSANRLELILDGFDPNHSELIPYGFKKASKIGFGRFGSNRLELRTIGLKLSITRISDKFSWMV
jgi:hypothetical protein